MESTAARSEHATPAGVSGWHALYTRHQHENVVAQALTGRGFEVFLPQYRTVDRWKDRDKQLLLPLFPNYVFLHGGLDRMLVLVTTPGVLSLVSWGGRAANIPLEEIEAVRRLMASSYQVEPHPFLKCGDRVRVTSGPLEGIEGVLVRKTGGYRLVLSVKMLSQSASVEVDISMVERVSCEDAKDVVRTGAGLGTRNLDSYRSYALVADSRAGVIRHQPHGMAAGREL
jgi:transcription antitermination factor NusG